MVAAQAVVESAFAEIDADGGDVDAPPAEALDARVLKAFNLEPDSDGAYGGRAASRSSRLQERTPTLQK